MALEEPIADEDLKREASSIASSRRVALDLEHASWLQHLNVRTQS